MFSRAVRPPAAWRRSTASGRASSSLSSAARPQGREVVSLSVLARPLHATREPSRS